MLTGGAAMPMMAPSAKIAPTLALGMPSIKNTGATSAPEDSTAAVDEPVTMPGNITISISSTSINAGTLWKRCTMAALSASSAPDASITVMNTMADAMMRNVST